MWRLWKEKREERGVEEKKGMSTMIIITIGISIMIIIVSYIISHKSDYPMRLGTITETSERGSQYECGIETIEEEPGVETKERFYMKYYKIGIIFLIFDLESILLYPGTVIYYETKGIIGYTVVIGFILLLILGLIYESKKEVI